MEQDIVYSYCCIPKDIWFGMPEDKRAAYKEALIQVHTEVIELEASYHNKKIIKKKVVDYGILTPEEAALQSSLIKIEQDSFVTIIAGLTEEMETVKV